MSDDLQTNTGFDITVPDPGEPLRARVIHPTNIAREQMAESAVIMEKSRHKKYKRALAEVERELEAAGYQNLTAIYEGAAEQFNELMRKRAKLMTLIEQDDSLADEIGPELTDVNHEILRVRRRGAVCKRELRALHPQIRQLKSIQFKLEQHDIALHREKAKRKARSILDEESKEFHDILIEAITGLGLCYRRSADGKEVVDRVKIAERHTTPEAHYYKVRASSKSWFGWRWALPRNLNPSKLRDEQTLFALTTACQRRVTAAPTDTNGLWLRVDRLGSTDGVIDRVTYKQIMQFYGYANHQEIPIPIGVSQGLTVEWTELTRYPHFLIAGASGSGKSNSIKNFLNTIIARQSPEDVRLILCDMKEGIEFKIYEDHKIPHLISDVILKPIELLDTLAQLEQLRVERSEKLRRVYATKLEEYNQRVPASERMARIVLVIDEYNAIHMNDPFSPSSDNRRVAEQIKQLVRQMLAKARSAGIHLIICTQAPYVEVLPGMDKANVSLKLCGRFIDSATSRAILGTGAAAEIPEDVPGRMIIQTSGRMWPVQTPLVTPDDTQQALAAADTWPPPPLLELPEIERQALEFTQADMIELAVLEYGGKLSATRMWRDGIKDTGRVTFRGLLQMARDIAKNDFVEHNGQRFEFKTIDGGGKMLQAVAGESLHSTSLQT